MHRKSVIPVRTEFHARLIFSGQLRPMHIPLAWVPDKESEMSFVDKAKDKAEELIGKVKESAGEATGDEGLKAEGKTDQIKANLKQAGEKIKDALK